MRLICSSALIKRQGTGVAISMALHLLEWTLHQGRYSPDMPESYNRKGRGAGVHRGPYSGCAGLFNLRCSVEWGRRETP